MARVGKKLRNNFNDRAKRGGGVRIFEHKGKHFENKVINIYRYIYIFYFDI